MPRAVSNWPVCVRKARSSTSCDIQTRNSQVWQHPNRSLLHEYNVMMANAIGGWHAARKDHAAWNTTHSSFAMPRGVRYSSIISSVNHELGVDNAWLPVMRTHTQQDGLQVGMWMHYARGCSDFAWNVGRTALAWNKCHAAVEVERRACKSCVWSQALARVSRKISLAIQRRSFRPAMARWYERSRESTAVNKRPVESQIRAALQLCAHSNPIPDGKANDISLARTVVLGTNALDYVTAATLAFELQGTDSTLDTIQIVNRCISRVRGTCDEASYAASDIEIWDLRVMQQIANVTALRDQAKARESGRESVAASSAIRGAARRGALGLPKSPRLFRQLDGSDCSLSADWFQCLACNRSASEQSCAFKCHLVARGQYEYRPYAEGTSEYGGRFPSGRDLVSLQSLGCDANPLSMVSLWKVSWGPLLGSVPSLA